MMPRSPPLFLFHALGAKCQISVAPPNGIVLPPRFAHVYRLFDRNPRRKITYREFMGIGRAKAGPRKGGGSDTSTTAHGRVLLLFLPLLFFFFGFVGVGEYAVI